MIAYPLTFPAIDGLSTFELRLHQVNAMTRSPWTGSQQVAGGVAAWWEVDLRFWPAMPRELAAQWVGFFTGLRGRYGTFRFSLPPGGPLGAGGGAPTLSEPVAAGARELPVHGLAPSSIALRAGDYLEVGGRLHVVAADAGTTAGGGAIVDVEPQALVSLPSGSAVRLDRPGGIFRLTSDEIPWTTSHADIQALPGIAAMEAL